MGQKYIFNISLAETCEYTGYYMFSSLYYQLQAKPPELDLCFSLDSLCFGFLWAQIISSSAAGKVKLIFFGLHSRLVNPQLA